ncbi:hypothetical protein [Curtobacterium sp. MEB011]|uniref:hypothetical protein n=1 Tax=Curtobacterium sp. MEB011 TaxID=3040285 RepID=UPI00254EC95A|nr:hypothetical protein [Curtobacterium sp. MEB011]
MTEDLDLELRRDAMHSAISAGSEAPEVAEQLYQFLTAGVKDRFQPLIDAERETWAAKGYDQAHDDRHGRQHLLVQAMQYELRGRHAAALALLQQAARTVALDDFLPAGTKVRVTPESGDAFEGKVQRVDPDVYRVGVAYYAPSQVEVLALPVELGDTIASAADLMHLPLGTEVLDRDGDRHTLHADGWSYSDYPHRPLDEYRNVVRNYLPAEVVALPADD